MRASSPKVLLPLGALAVAAAGFAFVCARGLNFSDPIFPSPMALQEPAWPAPKVLPAPQAATEAPRPADPPQIGAVVPQEARAGDRATQRLDGFLGPARPDGNRSMQIPEVTPDQAAAAARSAADLINGLLANGGQRRIGAAAQIDPDDAAAMAQSAAKMLNGFLRDNRAADEERAQRRRQAQ
jgi:hypothetical protein